MTSPSPTVILDLDGPLLDVSTRHYRTYSDVARSLHLDVVPFDDYWRARRSGRPAVDEIADESLKARFEQLFLELIESQPMLRLDTLQPDAEEALDLLRSKAARVVLCTLRREPANVSTQLSRLAVDRYFDKVLIAQQPGDGTSKASVVRHALPDESQLVWIGDTDVDVRGARIVGAVSWVVTCGIRDRDQLEPHAPDAIFDSLWQAVETLS